jgi:hypothetical protein
MTEPRAELQAPSATTPIAAEPADDRRPFVAPAVEDMGGLKEVTRLGGTV